MLCTLVFPVNILVSPVSSEFARTGFILKIAKREKGERERKKDIWKEGIWKKGRKAGRKAGRQEGKKAGIHLDI